MLNPVCLPSVLFLSLNFGSQAVFPSFLLQSVHVCKTTSKFTTRFIQTISMKIFKCESYFSKTTNIRRMFSCLFLPAQCKQANHTHLFTFLVKYFPQSPFLCLSTVWRRVKGITQKKIKVYILLKSTENRSCNV